MRRILFVMCMVLLLLGLSSCSEEKPARLDDLSEELFTHPPDETRPGAFWCWLNGNMTKAAITRDLEAMRSKGITRAEIWDVAAISNPQLIPGGAAFLSDSSVDLIKHAIAEGRRLKMRIGIVASSGWNAGGSWVAPDWASKSLFVSETEVRGPGNVSVALPFPQFPPDCPMRDSLTPVFYKDIAVLALPKVDAKTIDDLTHVVDLTSRFHDGQITWDVPDGQWVVLRFVCSNNGQHLIVPSPNSNGLFIDFFDPEATKRHLQYFMDRLGVTPENSADGGLAYFEFDSMELAEGIPWTDKFASIFKERQGYDVEKYLPVLAGWKVKDNTERFLYDFRKTVSEQLIFSHYRTGTEFLKKYHADLVSESGGPGPPHLEHLSGGRTRSPGGGFNSSGRVLDQTPEHVPCEGGLERRACLREKGCRRGVVHDMEKVEGFPFCGQADRRPGILRRVEQHHLSHVCQHGPRGRVSGEDLPCRLRHESGDHLVGEV